LASGRIEPLGGVGLGSFHGPIGRRVMAQRTVIGGADADADACASLTGEHQQRRQE
jgi:hypothetical protein